MKKFTENLISDEISTERVESFIGEVETIDAEINTKIAELKNLQSELDAYRKDSKDSKNDQIDDSYITMLEIIGGCEEIIAKLEKIKSNLKRLLE